tara:strand:+ start:4614 stop:4775 length:162 start_codon:yes stop_codon:yes gene_type:complete
MTEPPTNATLIDRIMYYVNHNEKDKGAALAKLGDYLEECFLWELTFDNDSNGN